MAINTTASGPGRKDIQTFVTVPGSAQAIFAKIEECVARFAETGESTSIDLSSLKSMPDERENLARLLGRGRVLAVVGSMRRMRTDIQETSIPCVWWIRLRNREDQTVGELIEITGIPDVITGDRETVAHELEALCAARSLHETPAPLAHRNIR